MEDCIVMPRRARFSDQHEYMVTFFHELAHAVGAPTRLNRQFGNDGTQARALEELVAELSSVFLAAHFGIEGDHANHESYIDSWLELLDRDKSAVIRAARLAEQAVGFILERYGSVH
jgi:antirestriction protein ArdC